MIPSTCVTVENFFQKANWQGLKIIPDMDEVIVEKVVRNIHLGLTVEDFFGLHNWQGIFRNYQGVTKENQELSGEINQPTYGLTMTVGEFFQRMVWHGQNQGINKKVHIASMPQMSDVTNIKSQSLNVNDLADLF
ncbi:MAG: hypothetical protein GW795_03585 [Cyanobacteria bacterium]|nr:hypothetical protein [Cyanobacteria bacterium CG_2015-16_32_12]NCO78290.1 hypothetical protein [Cyanobacteria bacterium CG_2015-22_32_23]NCQ02927.1 hypothetical protein [Cyanobacteria bacterium CG_2015-09_32_10]NCQ40979.1 hypothetical protein [Cyanobacteria bacterium CG_2015-04_32_10]NCS83516.1 hypothetical protein [Cyanobacteria bacterium CG_2015-02_32_10]